MNKVGTNGIEVGTCFKKQEIFGFHDLKSKIKI